MAAPVTSVAADARGNVFVNLSGAALFNPAGPGRLFRRAPKEVSWKALTLPPGTGRKLVGVAVGAEDRLFVASDAGLLSSKDAGDTRTACATDPARLQVLAADAKRLYVGTDTGVFVSDDSGATWSPKRLAGRNVASLHASGDTVLVGTVDPMLGSGKVFLSKDGGKTWTPLTDGLPGLRAGRLGANAAGEMLLGGFKGAVLRLAANGAAWTAAAIDPSTSAAAFALAPSGQVLAATNGSSVWRSADGGAKFTPVGRVGGLMASFMQAANGDLYMGMEVSGIHKSTDGGATWQNIKKASHNQGAMAFNARGELLAADGQYMDVMWRLAGGEWVKSQKGLPAGLSAFAMVVTSGGTVYIPDRRSGVYRSTDHGESWEPFRNGIPVHNMDIETLATDREGYLYAGSAFGGGIYRTLKPVSEKGPLGQAPPSGGNLRASHTPGLLDRAVEASIAFWGSWYFTYREAWHSS